MGFSPGGNVGRFPPKGRKTQNAMGATRTKSQMVSFDYHLQDSEGREFTLGVTAQVDFGDGIEYSRQGYAVGAATDDEVTALTCGWTDKKGAHETMQSFFMLPEAMRKAIEARAIEVANEVLA